MDETKQAPTAGKAQATISPKRILDAVAYLNQCQNEQRCLAILTGTPGSGGAAEVLNVFLDETGNKGKKARVRAPVNDRHAFLQTLLQQLGFDPIDSSADDLERLLQVVLREVASQKAVTHIVIEDTQLFGPHILEQLRDLIEDSCHLKPPPLFILGGSPALNNILDSPGMKTLARLTGRRFDLAAGLSSSGTTTTGGSPAAILHPDPCLVLSHGTKLIRRYPLGEGHLLIGRGTHSDITILDRFVSRQHALFMQRDGRDWIIDLNSTNGTIVNSLLVRQRCLVHGDIISLGNHQLLYHQPAMRKAFSDEQQPTAPAAQLSDTMVMRSLQAVLGDQQHQG